MLEEEIPISFKTFIDFRKPGEEFGLFPYLANEGEILRSRGVTYHNLPITGDDYTEEVFNEYYPIIMGSKPPLLGKCRTGFRAITFILMSLAKSEGKSSRWFLDKSRRMGFYFEETEDGAKVVRLAKKVLDGDTSPFEPKIPEASKLKYLIVMILLCQFLLICVIAIFYPFLLYLALS